jgi:ribonuclease VapC
LILRDLEIQSVPFDLEQMQEARAAWQRFGKGRHPAALNLGDCCAYAAAITSGEPLLYKGEDFQKTDVDQAQW